MNKASLSSLGALLFLGMVLEGCSSMRKTFGLERQAPDEFSLAPSESPLDMPPDFRELPTPMPGAPRPQDPSMSEKAFNQLTGTENPRPQNMSSGEAALLDMAGAEPGQENIRSEVDQESRMEDMDENLLEMLRLKKKKRGKVVNPYEASEELQQEGIPTSAPVLMEVPEAE